MGSAGPKTDDATRNEDLVQRPPCIMASVIHQDPKVMHYTGFLSAEEAAHIIALAEGRWVRSTVTRGSAKNLHRNGAESSSSSSNAAPPMESVDIESDTCTSWTVRFGWEESPIVERIYARAAVVAECPLENLEHLVLVRYKKGQVFKRHHDGAMRPKTVFIYLNDVAEGGETYFPELGFRIRPALGTAAMWYNTIDGVADRRVDHEARPPAEGYEKFAMNCFVNAKPQRDCSHIQLVQASAPVGGA